MIETETKTDPAPDPRRVWRPESEVEGAVPIAHVREIEVWARIKKTSKYFHQGLVDPTNSKAQVESFKVDEFVPCPELGSRLNTAGYTLRFNNNNYRLEDVELYLRDAKNPKLFLRIR